MVKEIGVVSFQLALLWAITQLSYFLVDWLSIPLPGNVVGILLLLVLLGTKIVPLSFVERGANLLVKHLGFFFIPIAVGLINFGDLIVAQGVPLIVLIVVSVIFGIYVAGFSCQLIGRTGKGEETT